MALVNLIYFGSVIRTIANCNGQKAYSVRWTCTIWFVHAIRDQRKALTPPLDADVYDTMLRTECGDLNCRCPESGAFARCITRDIKKHAEVGVPGCCI